MAEKAERSFYLLSTMAGRVWESAPIKVSNPVKCGFRITCGTGTRTALSWLRIGMVWLLFDAKIDLGFWMRLSLPTSVDVR